MKLFKKLILAGVVMVMSLGLFACAPQEEAEPSVPAPEPNPGVEEIQISHHDRTVDATVYRPRDSRFPIVVFSHGFGGQKDDFKGTANYLLDYGVGSVTFTFCGSGAHDKSGFPTTDMTLYTEKEDLLAVVDYAKSLPWFNGKLFLFGGSQGGMVSAMAAEDCAESLTGLALLFPAFNIPDDWNGRYPNESDIPATTDLWGVKLGRNFMLTLRNLDIYQKMPQFSKPVLLMHGTNDTIVAMSYSERAEKIYPNAELVKYPGEGHGFTSAGMSKVNERLLDFINDCTE